MSSHLLDDWDDELLDAVINSTEHATSSLNLNTTFLTPGPIATAPITSSSSFLPEKNNTALFKNPEPFRTGNEQPTWSRGNSSSSYHCGRVGGYMVQTEAHSPPRELSQKPLIFRGSVVGEVDVNDRKHLRSGIVIGKEKEVERLKRELDHFSKKYANMESKYIQLKNLTATKDGQLKRAFAKIEAKDLEINILKTQKMGTLKPNSSHIPLQLVGMDISSDWTSHDYPMSEGKVAQGNEQAVKNTDGISNYNSRSTAEIGREALNVTVGITEVICQDTLDNCTITSNGYVNQEHCCPNSVQPTLTKTIGVQAELDGNHCSTFSKDQMTYLQHDVSNDLFAIWGSSVKKHSERDLLSKLLVNCSEELYMLFRFMGLMSEVNLNMYDKNSCDMDIHIHSPQSVHYSQVSRFYTVLVQVSKGMGEMSDFLEVLADLCNIDNVHVAQKSLYILRTMLFMVFSFESPYKRALIGCSVSNSDFNGVEKVIAHIDNIADFTKYYSDCKSEDIYTCFQEICEKEKIHYTTYISVERQILLIEAMLKVAIKNTSEDILSEAFSIINLILVGNDPILEREKFGKILLTESFPKFLMKEVGVNVQRKALQALFLLLNCPKLMTMFCNQSKVAIEISENPVSNVILKGLSECLTCEGKNILELKLQRKAIIVLAFIASSGQSGFEILLKPVTQKGDNFLELVIQILSLEIGAEGDSVTKSQEFVNERISAMREALILLNRLASNASYSKFISVILTRNTTYIGLAIDVASKITRRSRESRNYDSSYKLPILESEMIDLANSFRTRVLSLGEIVS